MTNNVILKANYNDIEYIKMSMLNQVVDCIEIAMASKTKYSNEIALETLSVYKKLFNDYKLFVEQVDSMLKYRKVSYSVERFLNEQRI